MDKPENCNLQISTSEKPKEHRDHCDGCGRPFEADEKYMTGIESCCGGGCWRSLCKQCVSYAHSLFFEIAEDSEGRPYMTEVL